MERNPSRDLIYCFVWPERTLDRYRNKMFTLDCFTPDIFLRLAFSSSLCSSPYNACLIGHTVMYSASLKTLLLLQTSPQWCISSREPICIHANEAEWVHPSWRGSKLTLLQRRSTERGDEIFPFFLHCGPVGGFPCWYLLKFRLFKLRELSVGSEAVIIVPQQPLQREAYTF